MPGPFDIQYLAEYLSFLGDCGLLERQGRVNQLGLAVADFSAAIGLWPLWIRLGWNDILYRYRRSTLGPFWSTANIAITVIALGLVYSQLFNCRSGNFCLMFAPDLLSGAL